MKIKLLMALAAFVTLGGFRRCLRNPNANAPRKNSCTTNWNSRSARWRESPWKTTTSSSQKASGPALWGVVKRAVPLLQNETQNMNTPDPLSYGCSTNVRWPINRVIEPIKSACFINYHMHKRSPSVCSLGDQSVVHWRATLRRSPAPDSRRWLKNLCHPLLSEWRSDRFPWRHL